MSSRRLHGGPPRSEADPGIFKRGGCNSSVAGPICQEGQSERTSPFLPFKFQIFPLFFADFWQFFCCQVGHSAPLPRTGYVTGAQTLLWKKKAKCRGVARDLPVWRTKIRKKMEENFEKINEYEEKLRKCSYLAHPRAGHESKTVRPCMDPGRAWYAFHIWIGDLSSCKLETL